MEYLSEENWCAGWLHDLEFELWEWVIKWRAGVPLSPDEEANWDHWTKDAQALSWLAEQAGGWWRWVPDVGPEFVPMEEWVRVYEGRRGMSGEVE
jgi:hypothetical protein